MIPADLKDILGDTYDDNFFNNGSNYSKILESEGILIFNSFINRKGLINLQKESADLKYLSYQSSSEYNVYVSEYDNSFPDDSPRNRIMSTSKKCVPNDLIPGDSILQTLYNSKAIRSFFMDLLNKKELFPYSDPLSSININYYDKGDALGWHFDNSDFTKDGKEDYNFVEKILDKKVTGTKVDSFEGDLMIFKGNKSIHQVTAVEKGERILVTFNYNEVEGIPLSEESRKTFFGRIK